MTVPADYDGVTMTVEPGPLQMSADMIEDAAEDIVAALNSINTTLSNLQLGWDGNTAAEAQDFSNQWMAAMTGMFGSESDPQSGVMNQVIIALLTAAGNCSSAENAIVKMFGTLSSELGSSSSGSGTGPIAAGTTVTDPTLTAVAETTWTSIPG